MNGGDIAIAILAAGASRRLGRPKQLLPYHGTTLLRHAAQTALDAGCGPVVVVVGSDSTLMETELRGLAVTVILNDAWEEGMSSSIHAAVREVQANFPAVSAVLLMLCDQPGVSAALLREIVFAYRGGHPIVACEYAQTIGVPALFGRGFWPGLLALRGDRGAKSVIQANRAVAAVVAFPAGELDVDRADDLPA
jgi:molybdenum cofactor cytidylyltransferase